MIITGITEALVELSDQGAYEYGATKSTAGINNATNGTYTWTGNGTDTNWTNMNNWVDDSDQITGYPSGSDAVAKIGETSQSITLDTDITL